MIVLLWSCVGENFAVPEATVFFEEGNWEGTVSFVRFEGTKEQCRMDYSLIEGEELDCTSCVWEVSFQLEALSQPCIFSSLQNLSFRVGESQEWLVQEESGWEEWGTVQAEAETWEFISSYRFFE